MRNESRTLSRRPIFRRHWHLHVDRPSRVYTPRTHALRVHAHACPSTRTDLLLLLRDDNNKAGRGMEHGVFIVRWSGARTWFLFFFLFFFFFCDIFSVATRRESRDKWKGKWNDLLSEGVRAAIGCSGLCKRKRKGRVLIRWTSAVFLIHHDHPAAAFFGSCWCYGYDMISWNSHR